MPGLICECVHGEYSATDNTVWHLHHIRFEHTISSFVLESGTWDPITHKLRLLLLTILHVMVRDNTIRVCCRVLGKIGDLVDNPNQTPLPNGKQRRRVWLLATGTVVRSLDYRKWQVRLYTNNKLIPVAAMSVRVIDDSEGLPLVSIIIYIVFYYQLF